MKTHKELLTQHHGDNQRIKCNDISSIVTIKDIELFYCFIERLFFTSTRPSILDCVTSLLTHNDRTVNEPLQEQKLKYRYIIHEEDKNVSIVR